MQGFRKIDIAHLDKNIVHLISKDKMLVTAGKLLKYNGMTANWGGFGYLWNRPVAFVFIRPQRYTYELLEHEDYLTLSFFNKKFEGAVSVCGAKSGRHTEKMQESGLTGIETTHGAVSYKQASIILECKKLYADFIKEESFINQAIMGYTYIYKDFHKMFIVEITEAWVNEDTTLV